MIRLVSLNIEQSKHLDLVIPFLQKQDADVVCLQELMEYDIAAIETICGNCFFTPFSRSHGDGRPGVIGTGIFSKLATQRHESHYYVGAPDHIVEVDDTNLAVRHATQSHAVSFCDLQNGNETLRIATTHFTWTPDGKPDDYQRGDMKNMLEILGSLGEFVLCGDFNAPRGDELFSILASEYKDNIPARYTTSLDAKLHRGGDLQLMVDGLFSTPTYAVSNVALHSGVSDHLAITATISKMERAQ